jgi:hypothetical protein
MNLFLLYLVFCFVAGLFLWHRKPWRRILLLLALSFLISVAYIYFRKI